MTESRVLGIDLGQVRIGLALSDPLHWTAQPLESYRRVGPRKDLQYLARLIDENQVSEVVIGLPRLLSGEEGQAAAEPSFDVLALNEALDRLAELRPRAAKVVGFRFFLGMTVKETAELLRIAPRTVDLDWSFANAWLRRELAGPEGNPRQESPDAP